MWATAPISLRSIRACLLHTCSPHGRGEMREWPLPISLRWSRLCLLLSPSLRQNKFGVLAAATVRFRESWMEASMSSRTLQILPSIRATLVEAMVDWWRRRRDRRALSDLATSDPDEARRIARDFQMNVTNLLEVTDCGGTAVKLLERRAIHAGVDLESLNQAHPEIARDLARCCALCASTARCARDLKRRPESNAWRHYCPNRETLDAIRPNGLRPIHAH